MAASLHTEVHLQLQHGNPMDDPAERRLNELGYKQELRRNMTMINALGISFSSMSLFTGIIPFYGFSLSYVGPAGVVWGWVIVCFFSWFVAIPLAEICSSFPTTGSMYFWTAHLAGSTWGPFASWCCAWLEMIGAITGIGAQAYAGSQVMQNIILLSTGTNKGGGYLTPPWVFLIMYICTALVWAILNTCALNVVAYLGIISIWWQVIGGILIVILLPFTAKRTLTASNIFLKFQKYPNSGSVPSTAYGIVMSFLVSQYSLFGYDAAAHMTEETKRADKNGPVAILYSLGIVSILGFAVVLALTVSIQDPDYLYDPNNETAGKYVTAQILFDAFNGRYHNATGAVFALIIIWGSFFFSGLSVVTSAARIVYAFSRDGGVPFSSRLRKLHPKRKIPANAVWACTSIAISMAFPLLKVEALFTAIASVCTIGWVGAYSVPILARMMVPEGKFKPGPFHVGHASKVICLVGFLWVCYTCTVFLLPTQYPLQWETFNYAPVAFGSLVFFSLSWWLLDARKWFNGPMKTFLFAQRESSSSHIPSHTPNGVEIGNGEFISHPSNGV